MTKQKVINESEYSSRNTKVTLGSEWVKITRPPPTFRWKKKVSIAVAISIKTENLKYQDAHCSHPFIPIIFIDS